MAQRDRLGQRLVERQAGSQCSGDLRDLERVGQARDVVVAIGIDEDLRLVLQPSERLGVDDPIAVTLEGRAQRIRLFRPGPAARRP